ncbi:DoxX family protein [Marinobacterium arenosum]|uniref:DoxX family protein n=1 Tax=Marinobacterium arenosum TaxID=2862496 RepID=UPI001C94355D|nr:DoxX family protein [Marinobacterium arenosum]MBY4678040.1 DoxX family protein [Marinobacterium arenosum]
MTQTSHTAVSQTSVQALYNPAADLAGRILLALIFVLAGINKIQQYEGTAGWMDAMGVPGALLPLVIAFEIGAGLALIVGYQVRVAAFLMAGFTLLTGLIFHNNLADQTEFLMFFKNLAITGGLLAYSVNGAGRLSLDRYLQR